MKNNFILGGGITGLIHAFYNPDYSVISEDIGGRLNQKFFQNIIYLHHTQETEDFLNEVGIEYQKRTQLIKYCKENKLTTNISSEDKVNVIKKKLDDPDFNPTDLALSTSDYYIPILTFSYADLIEKISSKINFINQRVIRITEKEIVTEDTSYYYDNIVSTLPAQVFWSIYHTGTKEVFKRKATTFVLCDKEPSFFSNEKYDMVYFIDSNQKYVRISKKPSTRDESIILYEFTGAVSKEEAIQHLPEDCNILEYYVDYSSVIYTNKNNIPPKNVIFSGRFAEWNHSLKQQDVIKTAKFSYDLRHIFNRQANFSKFHIDLEKIKDDDYFERMAKEYLLLLMGELTEVLNELNYKPHAGKKKIDRDAISIELIDIFKYNLNLFILAGIDAEKFIDLFNQKSKIVENKLKR
jgi:hypothetical protein